MSTQKPIAWISAMFLIALITDCSGRTKVLTRNWGPQSTLYLKGKHGRRDVLEMEEDLPILGSITWRNEIQKGFLVTISRSLSLSVDEHILYPVTESLFMGSQGPKSMLEKIYKKLKLSKY